MSMKPQNRPMPRDIDGQRKEQPVRGPREMKHGRIESDMPVTGPELSNAARLGPPPGSPGCRVDAAVLRENRYGCGATGRLPSRGCRVVSA
jgi:hypothetical protein